MKNNLLILSIFLCGGLLAAEKQVSFPVRGLLPWHDFLSGPTTWDEEDYQRELDTALPKHACPQFPHAGQSGSATGLRRLAVVDSDK